jgi:hypothetical protein
LVRFVGVQADSVHAAVQALNNIPRAFRRVRLADLEHEGASAIWAVHPNLTVQPFG